MLQPAFLFRGQALSLLEVPGLLKLTPGCFYAIVYLGKGKEDCQ